MKVVGNIIADKELSALIDLKEELKGVPKSKQKELLDDIGELLVEQTLKYVSETKSPVDGYGSFQALSKDYKDKKKEETGSTKPNLDLHGNMIDSVDFKIEDGRIRLGVFGSEAPKADGHNNLSGDSKIPTRRFIPGKGEDFKSEIKALVEDTVRFYKADTAKISDKDLKDVQTKDDLYLLLSDKLGSYTRKELKEAVLSTIDIYDMLDDYDLTRLL